MPAYIIVQRSISDPVQYQKYGQAVIPLITKYGGKAVARGDIEVLEGAPNSRGMVMFEFPTMEDLEAFWNSPEYVPVKKLREGAAVLDVWAVPGT